MENQEIGRIGETIASDYLRNKDYKIIERNFQGRYGELDIITKDKDDTLVFVEVKTRIGDEYGDPAEAITKWKLREVVKTAEFYLLKNKLDVNWHIDAIAISLNEDQTLKDLEHFENITL